MLVFLQQNSASITLLYKSENNCIITKSTDSRRFVDGGRRRRIFDRSRDELSDALDTVVRAALNLDPARKVKAYLALGHLASGLAMLNALEPAPQAVGIGPSDEAADAQASSDAED